MTFEKLEKILAEMTPGKWHAETTTSGPMVFFERINRTWEECLIAPYVPSGLEDAAGIATLRNLAPLMLEVCKAAEDDAIMWNEEYCNRQECEQMSAAQARLTKAVTNLKAALADGSAP